MNQSLFRYNSDNFLSFFCLIIKQRTQIQSQIVRYNDLRAAIEKRKKLMQDIDYEHRERLEHPLDMARTRATELQSKQERS